MAYNSILALTVAVGGTGYLPNNAILKFPVETVDFSIESPASIGSQSSGAGAGKAKFGNLTVTKNTDVNSPSLFLACGSGTAFTTATLIITTPGSVTPIVFHTFKLVFIVKMETSGSQHGGTMLNETITLAYGAQDISYTDSHSGQTIEAAWNQVTNQNNLTIPGFG